MQKERKIQIKESVIRRPEIVSKAKIITPVSARTLTQPVAVSPSLHHGKINSCKDCISMELSNCAMLMLLRKNWHEMIEFMVPLKTPLIFWADATWHLNDGSVAGHVWHSNLGWGHLKAQIVMSLIFNKRPFTFWSSVRKHSKTTGHQQLLQQLLGSFPIQSPLLSVNCITGGWTLRNALEFWSDGPGHVSKLKNINIILRNGSSTDEGFFESPFPDFGHNSNSLRDAFCFACEKNILKIQAKWSKKIN